MKNKIEIKYVTKKSDTFADLIRDDYWEMTVWSDIVGKQVVNLQTSQAMVVALAIGIAKEAGKKEGYEKAKKKYNAIKEASNIGINWKNDYPWKDANQPMHWNPAWKLNDPNT